MYKYKEANKENYHFTLTFRFLRFVVPKMFIQSFCLPINIDNLQFIPSSSQEPVEANYICLAAGTNTNDMPRSSEDTISFHPIMVSNILCYDTNRMTDPIYLRWLSTQLLTNFALIFTPNLLSLSMILDRNVRLM